MISSSQRPLPDNTLRSQQTDIRALGWVLTHNFCMGTALDRMATGTGFKFICLCFICKPQCFLTGCIFTHVLPIVFYPSITSQFACQILVLLNEARWRFILSMCPTGFRVGVNYFCGSSFSWLWLWRSLSCGMWRRVVWNTYTEVSDELVTYIRLSDGRNTALWKCDTHQPKYTASLSRREQSLYCNSDYCQIIMASTLLEDETKRTE